MSPSREVGPPAPLLTRDQARAAYQAMEGVVLADGPPGEPALAFLASLGRAAGIAPPVDGSAVADLGVLFPAPQAREALVHALIVAACASGDVGAEGERRVLDVAHALGVRSHWLTCLGDLRRRRVTAVKWRLVRHAPDARRLLARTWAEDGIAGIGRAFLFTLGRSTDATLAARFRALEQLPPGTFGRAVFDHFTSRGIPFPGEQGGMPDRMVHHDLMHVLLGYDTDAAGECELAGFYAGLGQGDWFTFIMVALATFQLGLAVSPALVVPARGAFDPERVARAFLRGREVRVDLMGAWPYFAWMPLTMAEARGRLGLTR